MDAEGRAGLGVLCVGVKSAMPVNIQVEVFNAQFYICIYIFYIFICFSKAKSSLELGI